MPIGSIVQGITGKVAGDLSWSRTKRMMQNRHQWEVADLRASGLNPILSAGAAPSMGQPPQNTMAGVGQNLTQGIQNVAQRKNLKSQRGLMTSQGLQLASQTDMNTANAAKHRADTALSEHMATLAQTNNALAAAGLPRAMLDAEIANSASGRLAAKVGAWSGTIQAAAQGVGAYSLLRMRGQGAAAKSALRNAGPMRNLVRDTGPVRHRSLGNSSTTRFTTGKMEPAKTWINPKRHNNRSK